MGNQSSAPDQPPPPPPPPPPIAPPCDAACQRQKQLDGLQAALDQTQEGTPEYEQARIAYYTLLNGQGWLATEKDRIAREEITPVTTVYSAKYADLTGQQKEQAIFVNLAAALKQQEASDKEDNKFLDKQFKKGAAETAIEERKFDLQQSGSSGTDWLPYLFDALILILGIFILYKVYAKFFKSSQQIAVANNGK